MGSSCRRSDATGRRSTRERAARGSAPCWRSWGLAREGLGWYEATRHTFASQWVLRGGSIEKLKELLGHYSVVVTERYAHLRTDLFTAADHAILSPVRPADGQQPDVAASKTAQNMKKDRSRPVSRVLSPRENPRRRTFLSDARCRAPPASRTRRLGRAALHPPLGGPPPYLLLHRVGFAVPPPLPEARCALTAPFHPCHARSRAVRRSVLCGTFLRVAPTGR
jgi:hypothetical protein